MPRIFPRQNSSLQALKISLILNVNCVATYQDQRKLSKHMEEFYVEARYMLENVPDDGQIFTWREITHLGLDCRQMETIFEIVREAY